MGVRGSDRRHGLDLRGLVTKSGSGDGRNHFPEAADGLDVGSRFCFTSLVRRCAPRLLQRLDAEAASFLDNSDSGAFGERLHQLTGKS